MATYKEIKGVTVQTVDSDPVVNAGSWSSGGTMNTGKGSTLGTATGSSNAFVAGGYLGPPGRTSSTESYNGTSWTEVADIPTAYNFGNGFGTNTASVFAGTDPSSATTYVWNGSSWATPGNNLNTARSVGGTSGTSTAGAIFGGAEPSASAKQEHWDGTSWTETTDMNTGKKNCFSGTGIQTAAMCIGYPNSPFTAEVWNGSSWTEIAELNTARGTGSGAGTTTAALFSGGQAPGYVANTEQYNGTSWTELADLSLARGYIGNGGSGSSTATTDAIVYGGMTAAGPASTLTEEFSFPPPTASTLTEGDIFLSAGTTLKGFGKAAGVPAATWSSGGNMNTARRGMAGFGLQTAAVAAGGSTGSTVANSESYNGSSWTEGNDINTARFDISAAGTQTAGIIFSGDPYSATTETYDGTSYTEVGDLNTARQKASGFGTQPLAICAGGEAPPGAQSITESWDGSSWTEVGDLNNARFGLAAGIQSPSSNGIVFGGYVSDDVSHSETWNGTAWTETNNMTTSRYYLAGAGTAGLGLAFGGSKNPPVKDSTEQWNGTSWTNCNAMGTAREQLAGSGFAATALAFGGGPTVTNVTEEFTADATLSTVTVS